jgi:eukaryotic-like serine/threonine-protein kinase
MPLVSGTRLGPYEVVSPLGAGGMGEVYRARDTRLDRTVAIKVLPESLADDPQLRERFDREARALSQLAHPHICTLHDVGEHASTDSGQAIAFLVMEFLEGETLANRMARAASRGPGLAPAEAISIAIQIADALAAAHRAGVVHRDLKPANVMLTRSGAKLLDFGLAKTAAPAVAPSSISMMPTTPSQPLTAQGTILGTFHYMAPEQIEGTEADARSDIFAFGCVLHEMLTGQKAFDGQTRASLVAAILERQPPSVSALQPFTPPLADAIVRKCLAKKADERWQDAADLVTALRWVADGTTGTSAVPTEGALVPRRRRRLMWTGLVSGAVGLAATAGAIGWRNGSGATAPGAPIRFEVAPPADARLSPAPVASAAQLALSPDGRRLVFVAAPQYGPSQLWIRPLDGVLAQRVAGTEGASFPFWSPDSRFIGFFAGGKLKKVDIAGGAPEILATAAGGRGGTWGLDGTIVFSGEPNSSLSRVAAAGGTVHPATTFPRDQGATSHSWPHFLPDGRHYLFYQRSSNPEHQGVYVASLDSAEATKVLASTGAGHYGSGYLLFVRDGMLFAQAFDARALRVGGEAVRVAEHVGYFSSSLGYASLSVSPAGVLAYGPNVAVTTTLQWRDRAGATGQSPMAPSVYRSPRLSPDQQRVVVTRSELEGDSGQSDIWMLELARGNPSRVTFDPANEWFPAWSADGSRILFGSTRTGYTSIFQKAGGGLDELVASSGNSQGAAMYPNDASIDGRALVYTQSTSRAYDLVVLTLGGDPKPSPFLSTPFNEVQGRFSPNGRWMAYASDESGRFEVYVRPFPPSTGQWLVSVAGGMQPEWRRDGKELFYISADRKMMAVPVATDGPTLTADVPHALFSVQVPEPNAPYPTDYAATADGRRFLVNTAVEQPTRAALTVIVNWTSDLRK